MEKEDRLFEACRVLFGHEIELSREFLCYLQDEGVTSAFRKKAMEVHPDRALISGFSKQHCQDEFVSLQTACHVLRRHIASRNNPPRREIYSAKPQDNQYLQPNDLPAEKLLFGRFLYRMGVIEWRQLLMALTWQKSGRPRIGELGISLGFLDRNSVVAILKKSVKTGPFGVTAQGMGFLTASEVHELLLRQKRQEKKIGQFFVEKGLLSTRELSILLGKCKAHNRQIELLYER
ncbi:J domain-containing protein [Desulfopila aestuarii]|uniref:J domain-containing protein n=1 Tax=Desulfopila aestuarii TaxID=231440 RepID=UPI001161552A|nr:J domain-containing protein [Desulfopila aestuarii]